jgi:hypothetical protein
MSVPETPVGPQPAPPSRQGGCLSVLLALVGIVLMLPGVCSLVFVVAFVGGGGTNPGSIVGIWLFTFLLAAAGIALIVGAIRRA